MPFVYTRTIHFQDTDAAGVVYFANVLSICHEAYEAWLSAAGINLRSFFSESTLAIPITHASIDFFQPMFCGDRHHIYLTPQSRTEHEFMIHYEIYPEGVGSNSQDPHSRPFVQAKTKHVCIDPVRRIRLNLPVNLQDWLSQWTADSPES